jgi:hypothetical protein
VDAADTKSTEVEVARMLSQEYRRTLLHSILDSVIRDVEAAERQGIRLFDWRIEVSERAEIKSEED